ncbi:MAG TPA: hypothetical protein VIJ69_06980 [Actinomycetota bacterium]
MADEEKVAVRALDLISSPPGRFFLDEVRRSMPDATSSPDLSAHEPEVARLLHACIDGYWFQAQPFSPPVDPELVALAELLAASPRFRWWREALPDGSVPVRSITGQESGTGLGPEIESGWESLPNGVPWGVLDTPESAPFISALFGNKYRHETVSSILQVDGRTWPIRGPGDWVRLCRSYPRPVHPSQKDYWEDWLSRMDGTPPAEVVLPDWEALKKDWDAVYLSPWGYATCEGRLLKEHGESFFLVGWEPCMLLLHGPLA